MLLSRFLASAVLAAGFVCAADAAEPQAIIARFTDGLDGIEGRFVQRVFDETGNQREESSGTVALRNPRQFRWEYEQPFPQLIVADGDRVWVYDPDLEQVTVRAQGTEEQRSPLAVLIDPAELERQFRVADGGSADGMEWLVLTPHEEDAGLREARIGFDGATLRRMLLIDGLGQRTEIAFSDWERNPGFADDAFDFTPPEGVDVVGELPDAAEVFPIE